MAPKVTPEQAQQLCLLYRHGASMAELGRQFGLSSGTVQKHLHRADEPVRDRILASLAARNDPAKLAHLMDTLTADKSLLHRARIAVGMLHHHRGVVAKATKAELEAWCREHAPLHAPETICRDAVLSLASEDRTNRVIAQTLGISEDRVYQIRGARRPRCPDRQARAAALPMNGRELWEAL